MIVPIDELDAFITETLARIRQGVSDAITEQGIAAALPTEVQFQVTVVRSQNAVVRTVTSSPDGDQETVEVSPNIVDTSQVSQGARTSVSTEHAGEATTYDYRGDAVTESSESQNANENANVNENSITSQEQNQTEEQTQNQDVETANEGGDVVTTTNTFDE